MYPVILTGEEVFCLRVMLRTVMARRISEAGAEWRNIARVPEGARPVGAPLDSQLDGILGVKIFSLYDMGRKLETPLVLASLESYRLGGRSVIATMPEDVFLTLKGLVEAATFYSDGSEQVDQITARVQVARPAIKAAFEVAEEQMRASIVPNMNPLHGRN